FFLHLRPPPTPPLFPYTTLFRSHFIASYGYLAIFLLMAAESACIPIPSELIMTFGGALAAGAVPGSSLSLAGVIIAGVAGNVAGDRKSTRLNSSHVAISYAVFCL